MQDLILRLRIRTGFYIVTLKLYTLKRTSIFQKRWQPKFMTNLVCTKESKILFKEFNFSFFLGGQDIASCRLVTHQRSSCKIILALINQMIRQFMLFFIYDLKFLNLLPRITQIL